jgi:hypothetical protein
MVGAMARKDYAIHRWLGAVVGIQLFLWSLGGFIFATHDLDWVHGNRGRAKAPDNRVDMASVRISPQQAVTAATSAGAPETVTLRVFMGQPVYEIRGSDGTALIDARSGEVRSPISEALARSIATSDRSGEVAVSSISSIDKDPPSEYRGGTVPAWRVVLDDSDNTHIYIAKNTGRITARRNDAWRRFDFFWMLHTMDYKGRDNFNHWLLIGFSALGLITVLSGWFLWGTRVVRRIRKRRRQAAAAAG